MAFQPDKIKQKDVIEAVNKIEKEKLNPPAGRDLQSRPLSIRTCSP